MGFGLFILLNLVLFIRPAEIVPDLIGLPIYEWVILACLAASIPAVLRQLSALTLAERPINVLVLGLLPAVVLSHLSHVYLTGARDTAEAFLKIEIYFLLFVANVCTAARLCRFLAWLLFFIVILTALALAQYHEAIDIPALTVLQQRELMDEASLSEVFTIRLRSTGIYNDPNDLCMILVVGIAICLYYACGRRPFLGRVLAILPLAAFVYAIMLTQSRGGFLALLGCLFIFAYYRFGRWKTVVMSALLVPVVLGMFAGRQTNIDLTSRADTAQSRIQLWSEGIGLFRESPLFGIGYGEYAERSYNVAHNSFIHCYAELGLVGGTIFLGCFYCAITLVRRAAVNRSRIRDARLAELAPSMIAIVAGYLVSMMSLSRSYVVPTYMILGLASTYTSLMPAAVVGPMTFDRQLLKRLAAVSLCSIVLIYLFVRTFARWG